MRQYVAIFETAGDNYSAYVPDLPGCVAAGDTLEETETLLKEAIRLYIEELEKAGEPIPAPTTRAKQVASA